MSKGVRPSAPAPSSSHSKKRAGKRKEKPPPIRGHGIQGPRARAPPIYGPGGLIPGMDPGAIGAILPLDKTPGA